MKLWICVWGMFIFLAFLHSPEVQACSCRGPGPQFLFSDVLVPANAPGVVIYIPYYSSRWRKGGIFPAEKEHFNVERIEVDGTRSSVPFFVRSLGMRLYLVSSTEKVNPGEKYRFAYDKSVDYYRTRDGRTAKRPHKPKWLSSEVTIGEDRIKPRKTLAKLEVSGNENGVVTVANGGSCSCSVEAGKVSLELVLTTLESKYKHALLFETKVDGKLWHPSQRLCKHPPPGRSWKGIGKDLLFSCCDIKWSKNFKDMEKRANPINTYADLSKGTHKVRMTATLPGVGVIADSGEVSIDIGCQSP